MKKIPITREGYERIKKELEYLKNVTMQENIRDIEVARAHGDLSENAEYTAAKERQAFIHAKIREMETNLASAEVVELGDIKTDKVVFGATVVIADTATGKETTYRLVGPLESDIDANRISVTSPIGKALIGKAVGDEVRVQTPGGIKEFEILAIRN
ncbi:MAG TPA: transcription elongation factor GreA [Syntrophales bacterium]|nr:transcription elongation factor GreA [Syntrophales bacterium]HOM07125.1 transcription elongation factor GreA [Syntrophales bacterium]HOO00360.1 transcription elongation factor GreA [Syntrophales bacterium]HPC00431.1 transcription elongation factor GreA [Syntrophales bacterium]HPQ05514.1 transcription elongation factor GreA [Syntrophales bacterium]